MTWVWWFLGVGADGITTRVIIGWEASAFEAACLAIMLWRVR